MIDKVYPSPIGRIHRSSGTARAPTFKSVVATLNKAYQRGLFRLLEEVRDGELSPLALYHLDLEDKLATTISSLSNRSIEDLWTYLEDPRSGHLKPPTKRGYRVCLKLFFGGMQGVQHKTVGDISKELEALRKKLTSATRLEGQPTKYRTFNQLRALCQSYITNTPGLGVMCPLWVEVTNVRRLSGRKRPVAALTVQQVKELAAKMEDAQFAGILWTLCLTGMRRGEYVHRRWTVADNHIEVKGTKNSASIRILPKLCTPVDPGTRMKSFEKKLREVRGDVMAHPHVFRHTFYVWFREAAGDKVSMGDRVALYAGHTEGLSQMQRVYGYQNVAPHLTADAKIFSDWINKQKSKGVNPTAGEFFTFA